jgi:ribosome-binding factor A
MPSAREYPRSLRVNQVVREVLAEGLERLADVDDRFNLATITAVSTSPDLRSATVYFSSFEPDLRAALEERRGQLQHIIGTQARFKRTPKLSFALDPGVATGSRVDEILARLARGEHGTEQSDTEN